MSERNTRPAAGTTIHAYNAQSQLIYKKDQVGMVMEFDFNDSGRETHQRVTTSGGFDTAILRISTIYDTLGRVQLVTSYDDANRLAAAFNERAFFEVYPDIDWLHPIFENLLSDESLTADLPELLEAIHQQYLVRHRMHCKRLVDNVLERRPAEIRARGLGAPNLKEEFNEMLEDRSELNAVTRAKLERIVGQERLAEAAKETRFGRRWERIE